MNIELFQVHTKGLTVSALENWTEGMYQKVPAVQLSTVPACKHCEITNFPNIITAKACAKPELDFETFREEAQVHFLYLDQLPTPNKYAKGMCKKYRAKQIEMH